MMSVSTTAPIDVAIHHPHQLVAETLESYLSTQAGMRVVHNDESTHHPRVVISDYKGAMKLLDDQGARREHRIVVLTTAARQFEIEQSLQSGAHGYVALNSRASEMSDCIRTVASNARYICREAAQCLAAGVGQSKLTAQERKVLDLMASGSCNKAIASHLDVSTGTVKTHVKGILAKLGAASRTQAAWIAQELGLVGAS
jgi:two-component system response regulator DesR